MAKKTPKKNILSQVLSFLLASKIRTGIILIIIALIGYFGYRQFLAPASFAKTYTVQKGNFTQNVQASGTVVADAEAILNFPAPGRLIYIKVKKGDSVKKWQSLMGMDKGDLDAAVTAAWYKYLSADANAKQVEDSVKDHDSDESFTQKNQRVTAQTARDAAYDAWLSARRALSYSDLIAPFDGQVTDITTTAVWDTVGITDGVTLQSKALHFEAEVDESDYNLIKIGQKITLTFDAYPKDIFTGKVTTIGKSGVKTTGGAINIIVNVAFDKAPENLVSGLNGEAEFIVSETSDVITIPREYLTLKNDKNYVTVLKNGRPQEQEVTLGLSSSSQGQITQGLNPGDVIVITSP